MKIIIQFIICIYLNYIAAKKCKHNAELYLEKPYQPVYDVVHRYTPTIALHTPDYLMLLTSICVSMKYFILTSDNLQEKIRLKYDEFVIFLIIKINNNSFNNYSNMCTQPTK